VNLRKAGIGEESAPLMRTPACGNVGAFSVGGQIIDVAVPAAGEDDRVCDMYAEFARNQIARDNAAGLAIDDEEVQHFRARNHCDGPGVSLPFKCLIRA
jgi:hypothetical protein